MLNNSAGEKSSNLNFSSPFTPLSSSQSSRIEVETSTSPVVVSMSSTNNQQHRKKRPFCLKCSKPASVCLCSRFATPPIENKIGITILQHVGEKNHPLNSVRVASLGLRNLDVVPVSDIIHRAEFDIRPLNMSSNGGVGEKMSGLDERSRLHMIGSDRNGGFGGEIGRRGRDHQMDTEKDHSFMNGLVSNGVPFDEKCDFEKNSMRNAGGLQKDLEKVPSLINELEVNRVDDEEMFCIEKFGKCLHDVDTEGRKGFVQLHSSHIQQNCTNQESQIGNVDADHVEKDMYANLPTDRKCQVTYCPDRLLISMDIAAKPDLGHALESPVGRVIASNGFAVNKIKRKKMSEITEFMDIQEFDIVVPPGSALLFPSKKSIGLDKVDFEVKHLLVLDGTWPKARRMYYENPWLQFLPHLRLDSVKVSLYSDVRHQPKAGCLSTIESIVCTLKGLGCDMDGLENLLNVFKSMVEDQRRCKYEKLSKIDQSERA